MTGIRSEAVATERKRESPRWVAFSRNAPESIADIGRMAALSAATSAAVARLCFLQFPSDAVNNRAANHLPVIDMNHSLEVHSYF